ncbi:hypothetical protein [Acutalibacter sp. 1XD8-36]|uniref:hypothetical protein n=1 Tax=Acutalibacter sp. 1XD8-36 TaxID=2320852 RepID=UPI0014134CC8|nr:hypothetical protein [Acutalibacter sp. 1XD8-36]NBJ90983.1 hypothetical protein [Acutalibacter sp. 1XD8-36]
MDLLRLIILGLYITMLFFLTWYLVEKCFAAYDARKLKAKRRVEFQKAWRASTSYGDELDNIISK